MYLLCIFFLISITKVGSATIILIIYKKSKGQGSCHLPKTTELTKGPGCELRQLESTSMLTFSPEDLDAPLRNRPWEGFKGGLGQI